MADSGKNWGQTERSPVFRTNGDWLTTSLSLAFSVRICRRLGPIPEGACSVRGGTRPGAAREWSDNGRSHASSVPSFMTFTKKVHSLSFEVSVGEGRVYDMSSASGELCHAPPALRAARPAATPVPLPKSASVNLATTFVVSTNRVSEADESDRSGDAKRDYRETGLESLKQVSS